MSRIQIEQSQADLLNQILLDLIPEEKNSDIEKIKDGIITAYQNGNSLSKIANALKAGGQSISERTIKIHLEDWGVYVSKAKPSSKSKSSKGAAKSGKNKPKNETGISTVTPPVIGTDLIDETEKHDEFHHQATDIIPTYQSGYPTLN